MELKLSKPICFFDLETTGIDITKDRIVEISILKVYPNGNKESKTWLVNPTIPIPKATSDVHGINMGFSYFIVSNFPCDFSSSISANL